MAEKQVFGFQTEVKQLLDIVINSLYSNKEIFLRELISNSSDACEKLRFESLNNKDIILGNLGIKVDFDEVSKTITIKDSGIGMSRDEVIENLGTIAKSGTKNFLSSLTGDEKKDSNLIGKFGVGFYSSYIIADKVTVNTRRANLSYNEAVSWESKADGEFSILNITKKDIGTEIILHLKDGEEEFLNSDSLRGLISKYSDHISIPIEMKKVNQKEDGTTEITEEWETVNKAKALWVRDKSEIKDEEYKDFYKHISSDFSDPLLWTHNKVEGNLEYTTLLFIPERAPFNMWDNNDNKKTGLQLYVQRVFIMENAEVLPNYLRFVKGIIDSNDLPLNISREILQHNKVLERIKKSCIKKVLDLLVKLSKKDVEKYQNFWTVFGKVLKEGVVEDNDNKEKVISLLRFASTHNDTKEQDVSLDEYISRMKDNQKYIYYVTAESFAAAKNNPQLEIFRKKGVEVLLMSDRVDEWLSSHLSEYKGKTIKSVLKGDLDLGDLSDVEKEEVKKEEENFKSVIEQMKEVLKDKVESVKVSQRLTDSPVCLVVSDYGMTLNFQRLMAESGQPMFGAMGGGKPNLEINTNHKIIKNLQVEQDDAVFSDWTKLLYEQAVLAEGGQIEDPASFVKLMNSYLIKNV